MSYCFYVLFNCFQVEFASPAMDIFGQIYLFLSVKNELNLKIHLFGIFFQ